MANDTLVTLWDMNDVAHYANDYNPDMTLGRILKELNKMYPHQNILIEHDSEPNVIKLERRLASFQRLQIDLDVIPCDSHCRLLENPQLVDVTPKQITDYFQTGAYVDRERAAQALLKDLIEKNKREIATFTTDSGQISLVTPSNQFAVVYMEMSSMSFEEALSKVT